ncbi:hybrid signal transduction histidine kinase I-like [Teleopsis dalmanni]|uniref:hybrid signal transduction histidine kinase I-like n=1 Tax=Teleopsis dalmanni TaxID=139649 RepID=UPI0018CEFEFF|nr:hybrid signal transduction histidine kinase I-like [Teleopsis dalmanni]
MIACPVSILDQREKAFSLVATILACCFTKSSDGNQLSRVLNGALSEKFGIKSGVRQGDSLSTLLFNLTLHAAINEIDQGDENRDINMHSEDDIKRQRLIYNGDQIYSNIWSGKWCIKDEHKLLSELGNLTANSATSYYDTHNGFSTPATGNTTDSILYDSITTISQSQGSLYTPPIGAPLGSATLTPLVPINMQDLKLNPNSHDQNSSPFYTAIAIENSHYTTLAHMDNVISSPNTQPSSNIVTNSMEVISDLGVSPPGLIAIIDENNSTVNSRQSNKSASISANNRSESTRFSKYKNNVINEIDRNTTSEQQQQHVHQNQVDHHSHLLQQQEQQKHTTNTVDIPANNNNDLDSSNVNGSQNPQHHHSRQHSQNTSTPLIYLPATNNTHTPCIPSAEVASSTSSYTTMLPSFSHYSSGKFNSNLRTCGSVVPTSDYAYSTAAYQQYGGAYGSYGYSSGSGLLNSSYYYDGGSNQPATNINPDIRSPLAATRANSLASAASPTGSACAKSESSDIFLV